jgi:hypothetical protein
VVGGHRAKASIGGTARRAKGRHRAPQQRPERYKWLEAGTVALGVGAALASGSGLAQADTTVTVQQICTEGGANLVPMTVVAASELSCGDPAYWNKTGTVPGLFIAAP